jgi:hypothetical protein
MVIIGAMGAWSGSPTDTDDVDVGVESDDVTDKPSTAPPVAAPTCDVRSKAEGAVSAPVTIVVVLNLIVGLLVIEALTFW